MRFLLICVLVGYSLLSCGNDGEDCENIKRFDISVDTSRMGGDEAVNLVKDVGVLILPAGYSNSSKSVRLVIYCHSGGGDVIYNGSEAESVDFVKYFVSQGYAVMSMMGMPQDYSERLNIDKGRTVGSPVSLRSNILGYQYVIKNYRIAKDGCFVFSNSNGGLMASNIVNLTDIPVLAQAGIAPLISIEQNAWFVASRAMLPQGFPSYQNRANIIRIYGMKNISTHAELLNAVYEKDKVGVYDPFDYCMNQTSIPYRAPYLIFSGKGDTVIKRNVALLFAEEMNSRGSTIIVDGDEEYGNHDVAPKPVFVGSFEYMEQVYQLKLTVKKVCDFLNSYNPDI